MIQTLRILKISIFRHFLLYFRLCRKKYRQIHPSNILFLYIISINVLFQGIVDIVLKVAGYTSFFVTFPWRVDFLFLTAVSVLLGWQAISNMKRGYLDLTKNALILSFLVEIGLVISDVTFVIKNLAILPYVTEIRIPFVILTLFNIVLLLMILKNLKLYAFLEYKIDGLFKKQIIPALIAIGVFTGNTLGSMPFEKYDVDLFVPQKIIAEQNDKKSRED